MFAAQEDIAGAVLDPNDSEHGWQRPRNAFPEGRFAGGDTLRFAQRAVGSPGS